MNKITYYEDDEAYILQENNCDQVKNDDENIPESKENYSSVNNHLEYQQKEINTLSDYQEEIKPESLTIHGKYFV